MSKQIQIKINEDYLSLIPRPNKEQYLNLLQSIKDDGQLEPIVVNKDGVILDGHTRFEICSGLKLKPKYTVRNYDKKLEKEYVVISNLKRRQLNSFQMYEALKEYIKIIKDERRILTTKLQSDIKQGKRKPLTKKEHYLNKTQSRIAELTGLGIATIDKLEYIDRHASEREKSFLRRGTSNISNIYRELVNKRHKSHAPNIRNTRTYPTCKMCGGVTRFAGKCHVHKSYCCRLCKYGE